jgi:hypothetical protein
MSLRSAENIRPALINVTIFTALSRTVFLFGGHTACSQYFTVYASMCPFYKRGDFLDMCENALGKNYTDRWLFTSILQKEEVTIPIFMLN